MSNAEPDYEVVVVGGGINGAGIARDAALRGLSVLLLEKNDFGSGTSSWSSRPIHGGLHRPVSHLQTGPQRRQKPLDLIDRDGVARPDVEPPPHASGERNPAVDPDDPAIQIDIQGSLCDNPGSELLYAITRLVLHKPHFMLPPGPTDVA